MNTQTLLADIHAMEEDLLSFERKYGVRSETFYAAYAQGEEPENEAWVLDFTEWASVYRTWLARQADYRNEISPLLYPNPYFSIHACGIVPKLSSQSLNFCKPHPRPAISRCRSRSFSSRPSQ